MATVLVVEDDAAIANLVDANLRKEGHSVILARSVGEAWQHVNDSPLAAAIVDLHLPGVYGWELVRRMRGDAQLRNIPVLIVSADLGEVEKLEAETLGCDYMAKPFDLDAFLVKARSLIESGLRIELKKVRARLVLDVVEIEGTLHLEPHVRRFSDALEAVMADNRVYIPVTDARITTLADGRVVDEPAFVEVRKAELRAVFPIEPAGGSPA